MNINKYKILFYITAIAVPIFAVLMFNPRTDVAIYGPYFGFEEEYLQKELDLIGKDLDIRIKYFPVIDVETHIVENYEDGDIPDIAIMPNPQGVTNLGERSIAVPIENVIQADYLNRVYPKHLIDITTSLETGINYGAWLRLFPNSLIWYDISKIEKYYDVNFQDFDSLISSTYKIADSGVTPWCANSESSASTGWIQTNWLEDVILSKHGPEIYDRWSQLDIQASNVKIYSSMQVIDDLIFYPNHIHNGHNSIISKEFRNLPKVLLDDNNSCFLSWSGHYFRYYIPEEYPYGEDYGVIKLPKINLEDTVVGIGDAVVLIKDDQIARNVITEMISSKFGEKWSSYSDTEFISANRYFNGEIINNKLTQYEFRIVHDALKKDLFRYDASEIMDRGIGSNLLWEFFIRYINGGSDSIVKLLNELDKEI